MFCVECGMEGPLYESLCERCFLKKREIVSLPEQLDMELCTNCGALKVGKGWQDQAGMDGALESVVRRELRPGKGFELVELVLEWDWVDERNIRCLAKVEMEYKDLYVKRELSAVVRIHGGVCQRCSRLHGSYFEAIIQVRRSGKSKLTEDEMKGIRGQVEKRVEAMSQSNKELFISKVEEMHGGLDFYLSHREAARALAKDLAKHLGGSMAESARQAGMRDGREFYRMTYIVRLPHYVVDDVLDLGGRPHMVMGISYPNVRLLDLMNHNRSTLKQSELESTQVLGGSNDFQESTVVFVQDGEVQLIDPVTMRPVTLRLPEGFQVEGETVLVLKTIDALYIVPYDS